MSFWSGWFSSSDGNQYNEKVTQNPDGSTREETLSTYGGDKKDHAHTIVEKNASGHCTYAHHNPAQRWTDEEAEKSGGNVGKSASTSTKK
jgi:hypothetical protein